MSAFQITCEWNESRWLSSVRRWLRAATEEGGLICDAAEHVARRARSSLARASAVKQGAEPLLERDREVANPHAGGVEPRVIAKACVAVHKIVTSTSRVSLAMRTTVAAGI